MNNENKYKYDYPRPGLTVDIVIYTFSEDKLKVLLIERGIEPFLSCWALPGGFVNENENVFQAAGRELLEETNLVISDLYQFFVASDPGRDPRGWTVSLIFLGFTGKSHTLAKAGDDARNLKWFPVNDLPSLAFDHSMIIEKSLQLLKKTADHSIIDKELLPYKFRLIDFTRLLTEIGNTFEHAQKLVDRLVKLRAILSTEKEYYRFSNLVYKKIREHGYIEEQNRQDKESDYRTLA
jgi:8-oxo-dGTP diphosphatase